MQTAILRMHAWRARRRNNRLENCCLFVVRFTMEERGGEGRIVPVFEEGTWNRVEGHWNWWWYLKLANDHFVNLLILSPFHPRNELESA